jgi:hypothetical protein
MNATEYADDEIDPVLRTVVNHWMTKIKSAKDHKRKVFQKSADECNALYGGPKSWDEVWGSVMGGGDGVSSDGDGMELTFKVSVNKTFEFVTLFGPAMYEENPVRTVKPRMPVVVPPQFFGQDMMTYQALFNQESLRVQQDGLRSVLLSSYLNWTPKECGLSVEARLAIDEALIKGRGCLWTELQQPPASDMRIVGSTWDSVDNLLVDPDAHSFNKATWIARKCIHPTWQVERDFGLPTGSIRGNMESQAKQADIDGDEDAEYDRKRGSTNDLLVYWKIYSKMGIGGRLQGIRKDITGPLEMFGDYVYLAVADGIPYPLNLCPADTTDPAFISDPSKVFAKVAWPTPFWGQGEFPVSVLDFHAVHNSAWPMPHLKAGMGELKFLNWCMSFLMGKIRNTSRDFVAIIKEAGEELKASILEGRDLTLLEIDSTHKNINEVVQFLQHPQMNGDIWKVLEAVEANFDKRVGLTELMYGQQGATQIRSASEAQMRNQNMNVRPDDMRKQVEEWMSRVAAKEAICARYHLLPKDIQPALGQMASMAWSQYVYSRDVGTICRQLEYQIEAGSTQRKNKNWEQQTVDTAVQTLMPVFQAYAQQTLDMTPMNNLIGDYAKAHDLDENRYQLKSPVMPTAPPAPAGTEESQAQGAQ